MLTDDELAAVLLKEFEHSKQKDWAKQHDISPQFVTDVLKGRKPITPRLAQAIGYRLVTRLWEKIPGENNDAAD